MMEAVLRAAAIYLFLFIVFRIAGKRSLAEVTTFDFVLLLVIGEAASNALSNDDFSITSSAIVITTLIGIDILLSQITARSELFAKAVDSVPLILIDDGELLKDRMKKVRISDGDILQYAREAHGLERLDQIKYAVLERSGGVSIIPKQETGGGKKQEGGGKKK
jgi:uncharacterized membrane protein YcaP (DUF421 family)